jgi:threonine synthase
MKFYSTNSPTHLVSLSEAVVNGLASDHGLYMPEEIPVFSKDYFTVLPKKTFQDIAYDIAKAFVEEDISDWQLKRIIDHTISFEAPLVKIEENIFALELFHGPTLAFKDFGARFISQLLSHFARQQNREIVILVATSGDTGSAVANGFLGVPGTRVVVLYPSGKVSDIQEKQFTTLGKNTVAIEVAGTFDDCQHLVKQAFLDKELKNKFFLTSANSINIARLIPQMFYYFYAWARLADRENVVFSVPSGNFGNLTAGLIAKKMGLPIHHFVAATNANDIVPHYLVTKKFLPKSSINTVSTAMDVGNPSNFARLLDLFHHDHSSMQKEITAYSFTDDDTRDAMMDVFSQSQYTLDPHGAVGYLGLKKFHAQHHEITGVFLETAHPAKFLEVVETTLQTKILMPDKLKAFLSRRKKSIACNAHFSSFKKLLLKIGSPDR